MEYRIERTNRKTIAIYVKPEGVVVRAPKQASERKIRKFVKENEAWIENQLALQAERRSDIEEAGLLTAEDINKLANQAMKVIPERVAHYAPLIGVTPNRIIIRNQKTKWGSCSSKGNLNFNCLLMLTPPQVIDSIVVHELCHLKEMNHSDRFYEEVLRVFPDYRRWQAWLKEHGPVIMGRMTGV